MGLILTMTAEEKRLEINKLHEDIEKIMLISTEIREVAKVEQPDTKDFEASVDKDAKNIVNVSQIMRNNIKMFEQVPSMLEHRNLNIVGHIKDASESLSLNEVFNSGFR